jgi:hypothetical protein
VLAELQRDTGLKLVVVKAFADARERNADPLRAVR